MYERSWGSRREGGESLQMERDAVAREQKPHRRPLKTTADLSNGEKEHRD